MTADRRRIGFKELVERAPEEARVLIVEDEPEVRKSLKKLIDSFGHEVKAASSAEEADAWLGSQRFDLCLLDIELPKMKGVEFLGWALDRDPEMAVIMLTGIDDPGVALECLDHGARTYLVKPVELEFLRRAVRDALAVRDVLTERNDLKTGTG